MLNIVCISMGRRAQGTLETFPACMSVPGIPRGQPSYQRTLDICGIIYAAQFLVQSVVTKFRHKYITTISLCECEERIMYMAGVSKCLLEGEK